MLNFSSKEIKEALDEININQKQIKKSIDLESRPDGSIVTVDK